MMIHSELTTHLVSQCGDHIDMVDMSRTQGFGPLVSLCLCNYIECTHDHVMWNQNGISRTLDTLMKQLHVCNVFRQRDSFFTDATGTDIQLINIMLPILSQAIFYSCRQQCVVLSLECLSLSKKKRRYYALCNPLRQ